MATGAATRAMLAPPVLAVPAGLVTVTPRTTAAPEPAVKMICAVP